MPCSPTVFLLASVLVVASCGGGFATSHQDDLLDRSPSVMGTEDAGIAAESLSSIFGSSSPAEDLRTQDLVVGTGPSVQMGDMAKVHYVGRLPSGKEFDSSRTRGRPFEFTLGRGAVIRGFERGMVGMKIGGIRRVHIPYRLAYGDQGSPPAIAPRTDLDFEIELLDVPLAAPPAAKKEQRPGGLGAE